MLSFLFISKDCRFLIICPSILSIVSESNLDFRTYLLLFTSGISIPSNDERLRQDLRPVNFLTYLGFSLVYFMGNIMSLIIYEAKRLLRNYTSFLDPSFESTFVVAEMILPSIFFSLSINLLYLPPYFSIAGGVSSKRILVLLFLRMLFDRL